ncbi:MAG TPA: ATPase, T2SS/T4P/T4SS family [Kiritimatiellia bacterium]|nr:ATPase, T2SS/T4P/T4SS family [Kiritimatiellia bacterium]HNR93555.1 ATPase, T2SS/T4P/T4SS family [Kiritimatiellia bacterium]HNS80130.1 ATPase, T2SS/T4P/T4SS family [Kiritimatiellia bacterium]HPA77559.1 ATPase, T2SS/T4P/T4SS family [Kiritimatiellia bacterium]HQQ04193.1 ATPase, T2SS/T4P/T4SS family [Kiritimatiellia bacterium]
MAAGKMSNKVVDILIKRHKLDPEGLDNLMQEASEAGARLEDWLVKKKAVSQADMTLAVAEYLRMPPIELQNFVPDPKLLDLIPSKIMGQHLLVPMCRCHNMLTIALGDPFDVTAQDEVHALTGLDVFPVVAAEAQIKALIQKHTQDAATGLEDIIRDVTEGDIELSKTEEEQVSLDEMLEEAEDAPVIRVVNSIMVEAIRRGASDIHIEPMERSIRLRYRIDGELYESPSPPKPLQAAIISRLKIMSNLDIAERRIPQDGRFRIRALGKEVDIRLSILPCVHGEKIVMRTLDKTSLAPSLAALNLEKTAYENLMFGISQPHGLILVTGPTGSGKTTTLYSALQELNTTDVNIITVEDPVEYQLAGINQVQTQASVGLTFAAALRSILRQDPDIVLVGETRDGETAAIAIQAALTGHLVLTTLHTNDAAGAVSRLLYMGIEPFMLASSLIMAQAQRLYRKLCPVCKQPIDIPTETLRLNHLDPAKFEGVQFFYHKGCPKCGNIGYKGRGAVMEILMVNDHIRKLILDNADSAAVRTQAVSDGMRTLLDVGLDRVRDGLTSIEEALSVAGGE